ncbi:hypothetical protein Tsubulata_026985 [Turnera subulata]|uniref:Uncharacterized protein n=1 Tax=Turnera subulata TaxID=218843 RepID=A0A9Q0FIZ6_9ROSI|nr:hypothetical protein Tsubulata_026985 [Turnera subulata]
MVALAKVNLLFTGSQSTATPLLSFLICPFALKVTSSFSVVRRAGADILYASRLFFFQLSQIAFDSDHHHHHHQPAAASALGNNVGTRFDRALRLVYQRVANARRSSVATQTDQNNFHSLSVFSL